MSTRERPDDSPDSAVPPSKRRTAARAPPPGQSVVQLRVQLAEVHPPVWRRLLVPGSVRLAKLRAVLQAGLGWTDSHLHSFRIGSELYGMQFDDFPDGEMDDKSVTVIRAVSGHRRFVSNGAAFAALLYCQGETFDGRLLRVVIDDPVTDATVTDCAPDPSVGVAPYWTGALGASSVPGTDCSGTEYVCPGGTMLGIDVYAEALGVEPLTSVHTDHLWHWYAPELADWSDPAAPSTSDPEATVHDGYRH